MAPLLIVLAAALALTALVARLVVVVRRDGWGPAARPREQHWAAGTRLAGLQDVR